MLLNEIWQKISRHLQQTPLTKLLAINQLYSATVRRRRSTLPQNFLYNIILRMDCSRRFESWGLSSSIWRYVLFLFLDVFPINVYLLKDKQLYYYARCRKIVCKAILLLIPTYYGEKLAKLQSRLIPNWHFTLRMALPSK